MKAHGLAVTTIVLLRPLDEEPTSPLGEKLVAARVGQYLAVYNEDERVRVALDGLGRALEAVAREVGLHADVVLDA